MRMMLWSMGLVATLLPLAGATAPSTTPAAEGDPGASEEFVQVGSDWVQNHYWLEMPNAFRERLDTDGDGIVSSDEERAAEIAVQDLALPADCTKEFSYARIGGHAPVSVSVFRHVDARGPVDHPHPPRHGWYVKLQFPVAAQGEEVSLRLGRIAEVDALVECAGGPAVPLLEEWRMPWLTLIVGSRDSWIQPNSVYPPSLRDPMDLSQFRFITNGTQDEVASYETNHIGMRGDELAEVYGDEIRLRLGERPPEFPLLAVAAGTTAALAIGLSWTEIGRFRLRQGWLALGLFSRLTKERALENPTRDAIVAFVKSNPGATFGEIRAHLGTGHGTLVHHLRALERQRLVRAHRDGFRCRVFPVGIPLPPFHISNPAQERILELVVARPGVTQARLARSLRMPRRTVSYHVGHLERRGALQWTRVRGRKQYFGAANSGTSNQL